MRALWDEFRRFAFKGNVIDMAVGVMIGAAFGTIVNSVVNDLFMPLVSLLTGRIDFTNLTIQLGQGENAAAIKYGAFLQAIVNFAVIAICVFGFVKMINRLKKQEEPAVQRVCPFCQEPIKDSATRCPHCTSEL